MGLDRPIDITAEQQKTLLALLKRHLPNTTAWVYGSRVKWTARPQSDLDLVVFTMPDQDRRVSELREAFEESNLPFRVDLFVWDAVPEQFHKQIETEHVVLVEREERGVASEWREVKLGELGEVNRGRSRHRPRNAPELYRGPYPFVQTGDIKASGGRITSHTQTYNEVGLAQSRLWPANTMVITIAANIAETAILTYPACFPDSVVGFVAEESKCDVRFVEYMFRLLRSKIQRENVGTGSVQDNINLQTLDELRLLIPPLPEQRAIAHVLGTLDDKIELNRRMNETLEAMARALFKSWFIDFDPVRAKAALRNHSPLEGESAKAPSGITPPLRGSRRDKGASTQMSRWGAIKRFYTQQTLQKAQTLRESQTNAEGLLWHYLRDKQLAGHKFRRQQPIGPYIVDFACMPKKLLIELDGGQHAEQHTYDKKRDEFLREKGYKILRFWNNDVFENCFGVLEAIRATVQDPPPQQSAPKGLTTATPPQGGSDWSVERARAYLDRMPQHLADLFPDRLVDSELGPIPEGWEVGVLDDMVELLSGGTPKTSIAEYWDGDIPWYTAKDAPSLSDVFVLETERSITQAGVENSAAKILPVRTTVITARGTVGRLACLGMPMAMNQTCYGIRGDRGYPDLFTYLSVRMTVNELQRRTHGTIFDTITRQTFKTVRMVLPPPDLAKTFESAVSPTMGRILSNLHESRTLSTFRDALLPRLISGEFRAVS